MKPPDPIPHPASFRDPSGFVFRMNGLVYRQVNQCYAADYDRLIQSGLYQALTRKGWLVPHEATGENLTGSDEWHETLLPQQIGRISYVREWSPGQLKDAALLTLNILETAIAHGMILKDASPYNVQFVDGRPLFIDSLSFERYDETKPWVAYRQFCECFLFPLYLQHYLRTGIGKILGAYPEGIPAAVTAKLLPWKSRFNAGAWLHVMMQKRIKGDAASRSGERGAAGAEGGGAGMEGGAGAVHGGGGAAHGAGAGGGAGGAGAVHGGGGGMEGGAGAEGGGAASAGGRLSFSKKKLSHLTEHLKNIISGFKTGEHGSARGNGPADTGGSAWSDYYDKSILSGVYLEAKEKLFLEFIGEIRFGSALDLGANNGHFSRLLALKRAEVIAVDADWPCIDELYQSVRKRQEAGTGGQADKRSGTAGREAGAAGKEAGAAGREAGDRQKSGSRQIFSNILPLCVDISDPTPAAGFRNAEHASFTERMRADLVVALALVHHLVLGKNLPLAGVARYFAELAGEHLLVEFVPLSDEKAQELIRNKSRWHTPYDAESFERSFGEYFSIGRKESIPGTERTLYLMVKKDAGDLWRGGEQPRSLPEKP
jgi:hypothetical protein